MNNLQRFDFAFDMTYGIDYALNADPDHKFPHQLVRSDTKETVARVRDPELAIALAAIWNERLKLKDEAADRAEPSVEFPRESSACCHVCYASKGQPHADTCTARGVV